MQMFDSPTRFRTFCKGSTLQGLKCENIFENKKRRIRYKKRKMEKRINQLVDQVL